jgi:hypothetical protein
LTNFREKNSYFWKLDAKEFVYVSEVPPGTLLLFILETTVDQVKQPIFIKE